MLGAAQVGGCGFGVSVVSEVRVDWVAAARDVLLRGRCRVVEDLLDLGLVVGVGGSGYLLVRWHELIDNWVVVRHGS